MFSTGQIYFAIIFVIVFVTIMFFVYKKDLNLHKLHYKGSSKWVLVGFISFVVILFILKYYLKNY
jgi:membrane protease YdiL (CAAX protease family)